MNRSDHIQRWRRARRANSGPHIGKWVVRLGAGCLVLNLVFIGLTVFGAFASVAGVYAYFAQDLPDPTAIQTEQSTYETVKIFDRTGQHLLYESIDPRPFRGDRTYLPLDQIPLMLRNATIALEDRDFYTNIGINIRGLGRAFVTTVRGQQVQGGSSITQQLVKQILIDPEERYQQSYARKIKEVIMALEITRKYPGKQGKDQILEWYLNHNFYSNAAYGVEAAARVYYDKSVADLTLDEIAVLTAIPQYPGLNPIQAPADAYRRQRKVLTAMQEAGYLTQGQVDGATRYFNTRLLNDLVDRGLLAQADLPLIATGDRAATARALNAMVKADMLTQIDADAAKKLNHNLWQYVRETAEERFEVPPDAPHFALYVLHQLEQKYNTADNQFFIWQHGLQVYTTLDWDLQVYAECVARSHIAAMEVKPSKPCQGGLEPFPPIPVLQNQKFDHDVTNASVVAIRPPTGEVLAMVGSLDYFDKSIDGQVNVSVAERQPGSSFKPYTYLTAFASGNFGPASMAMDVRTVFPDPPNAPYAPENFDRTYHGPQLLRWALQRSYNIPAVWLMDQVGVGNVIKTARRLGLSSLNRELNFYGLALTLGGGEVRLLDHTYAFSTLANGGVMAGQPVPDEEQRPGYRKVDPVFVLEVRDKDGNTLERYEQPTMDRAFDPAPVYMLNNVLSDPSPRPVAFGTYAQYLTLPDRPVAAKTGTTNNFVDDWTIGYTPQLAVGVWTGNSDNKPMKDSSGSLGAAPIWHAVMQKGMEGLPVQGWKEPPGIQHVQVCVPSGLLPTPDCPQTTTDLFLAGHAPAQRDNMYQGFDINKNNGKLATSCTPPDAIEHKVYEIYPLIAADWIRDKNIPQPPKEQDGPCDGVDATAVGAVVGDIGIGSPYMGQPVRGSVAITGTARGENFRAYKLEVASEAKPDEWTPIGPEHGEQVTNGHLETWDTTGFEGLYRLRLTVIKNDGSTQPSDVQVIVDNTPPKVTIIHPTKDSKPYVMEDDEMVSITADAEDTWAMSKVEFYLDGRKLGESTVAPYSLRWTIAMSTTSTTVTETHSIKVKAFDRAGNEAESEPVEFKVMHKPAKTGEVLPEDGALAVAVLFDQTPQMRSDDLDRAVDTGLSVPSQIRSDDFSHTGPGA
jgi:membrane peptidoglycan carboxypeptidase